MMGCNAAIFDMDGTILDTLDDIRDSINAALVWAGFPERSLDEVRAFIGNGAARLVERAVPAGTDSQTTEEVLAWYKPYYEAHAAVKTGPYPGIPAALSALKAAGVKLAVVSNKPDRAVKKLAERYFPGLFDAAIGVREGAAVKPAPDTLFEAMALLGATAADTVYVGDSDVDIATAKNAGTLCISVTWGFRSEAFLRESGGTVFARDEEELRRLILSGR